MGERNLIILAEDTPGERDIFVQMLQSLNFEVRAYNNGKLALEALKRLSNDDLSRAILLSDLVMPEMTGGELTFQARHQFPIPIMVWSRTLKADSIRPLQFAGANHVCPKFNGSSYIEEQLRAAVAHFDKTYQPAGPKNPLDHAARPKGISEGRS